MIKALKNIMYPVISFGTILLIWLFVAHVIQMPRYLIPTPGSVVSALYMGYVEGIYWPHFLFTLKSTTLGYISGCSVAIVMGALMAEFKLFERLVFPIVIALQAMPKVALAPLIIVWFGFGIESKVIMVALVCFFPLFVNTATGLMQVDSALLDMSRAFSASRWMVFVKVKLPSAAGHIFAGLQISIVLSLIGAVVAEFVASTKGLGYMISAASVNMDTHVMFAALVSLAVMGISGSTLIRYLHRRIVFWDRTAQTNAMSG